MASALDSAGRMINYGIGRIPAVVFDGRATIVGEADLSKALDAYCRRSR